MGLPRIEELRGHTGLSSNGRMDESLRGLQLGTGPASTHVVFDVTRRVAISPPVLDACLDRHGLPTGTRLALEMGGFLMITQPAERVASYPVAGLDSWKVSSRLTHRGHRLRRKVLVDVWFTPHSGSNVELQVRPSATKVVRWPPRRRRLYFRLAHSAADALVRMVTETFDDAASDSNGPSAARIASMAPTEVPGTMSGTRAPWWSGTSNAVASRCHSPNTVGCHPGSGGTSAKPDGATRAGVRAGLEIQVVEPSW